MGESKKEALRVQFDPSVKLEFHGAKLTSDGGLLLHRDLDEVLGLTALAEEVLQDSRTGQNTQHTMTALLRQSVYGRLAGYEDTNDAPRLRIDPTLRQVVGGRAKERAAASTSQMSRFETEILISDENLQALADLCGRWVSEANRRSQMKELILDMDSSESPTHGQQEGSAWNGHFECTCYHPLFCFNQFGDLERAMLREGNVHSADNWRAVLEPVVARYRELGITLYFRGDAAFANPELYEYVEPEGFFYAIRLPANDVLHREIDHLMTRPVGRPSVKPKVFYHSFLYQAGSWDRPRRVVAKLEWHCDELFPRIGFIVTNLRWRNRRVVEFYNKRGTAEQWIKEGKIALTWTRLSCHDFRDNEVRLQLFALAYNLGNFLRTLALPRKISQWTLTTLREKLIKIGAKVVHHARFVTFQMAAVAIPRELFASILDKIAQLRLLPGTG
ncbi:MAG: IS1380 family transposase [Chloroflexi bacterium]|nr:IS1380 family transposase [Chloroflexota bacterium]